METILNMNSIVKDLYIDVYHDLVYCYSDNCSKISQFINDNSKKISIEDILTINDLLRRQYTTLESLKSLVLDLKKVKEGKENVK